MTARDLTCCLVAALLLVQPSLLADKLVLKDGREFEGLITEEEDSVTIALDYGQVTFPRDQIEQIAYGETPAEALATKLAEAPIGDPEALYEIAEWAREQGLQSKASDLFAEVIAMEPDHEGAHRALSHVQIDGIWQPLDRAIELARSKLDAGDCEPLLEDILPAMSEVATEPDAIADVKMLRARAELRCGHYEEAATSYAALAESAKGDEAFRYETIAAILTDSPDGMYVVREPFPPRARLLGEEGPSLEPGPASLSRPLVLAAALHAEAREIIERGRDMMAVARKLEAKQPEAAHLKYQQASREFAQANALIPGLARSHRIEAVRRRIKLVRDEVDAEAAKLDAQIGTLAREDMSPAQWREKLLAMIRRVDRICMPLKQVLALAEPYPRELFLEIQWAEADLKKMQAAKDLLTEELHGQG